MVLMVPVYGAKQPDKSLRIESTSSVAYRNNRAIFRLSPG